MSFRAGVFARVTVRRGVAAADLAAAHAHALVGIKILTADLVYISDLGSLAIIGALLAGVVVASHVADRLDSPHPTEEATRRPPRCPKELTPRDGPRADSVGGHGQ